MNTTTKDEREQLIARCRELLQRELLAVDIVQLLRNEGISSDRARSAVATAQRRMRGEQVKQREYIRRGINLDDASMERIVAIEAATGINGASAVVREALKRMAESLQVHSSLYQSEQDRADMALVRAHDGDRGLSDLVNRLVRQRANQIRAELAKLVSDVAEFDAKM